MASSATVASIASMTVVLSSASSARADDAACIAASENGLALQQKGKLRDALTQLAQCASSSCPAEVSAECAKRIEGVNGSVPTLILSARDAAGTDLAGVKVTVDGAELPGATSGRALSLDPGEHTFKLEAPGLPSVTKVMVLRQGEKDRRETIVLLAKPAPPPPPPVPTWNKWRTLAVVTGGVGLVGLGIGAAFGALASSSQSREKTDCASPGCHSYAQGMEDYSVAVKNANASTGALVAGGVLVGAGIVIWFAAPKPSADPPSEGAPAKDRAARSLRFTPVVGAGSGRMTFEGSF